MASHRHRIPAGAMALLVTVASCSGRDADAPSFTTLDSAGVPVVESARPHWDDAAGWTLSPKPEVTIGQADGDERYLLNRVESVRRLSDGRIAVLDAGSYRVRVYDETGRHLMDLGREGDGPGEFRRPQFLGAVSDTLFVYEYVGGRITWFAPDGQFLRTTNPFRDIERPSQTPIMLGDVGEGTVIGLTRPEYRPLPEGLHSGPRAIWRYDLLAESSDSLLSVLEAEEVIASSGPQGTMHRPYVFGKFTCLATSRDRIFVGPNETFSIQVFDQVGVLRRVIRRSDEPRRVTRSDVQRWIEYRIDARDPEPDERAAMLRSVGELTSAETMPAFRSLASDTQGNLWVQEWEDIGVHQGTFSVFRADGAWLGRVDLPDGLVESGVGVCHQPLELGSDYVLGVWADGYGVQQVRLYRIEKG